MEKLPQIQVGRGIAALMVVLFHSYIGVRYFPDTHKVDLPFVYKWGFLGVNLFFCISGFIIGMVCDRSSFSPGSFLVKRFFRIYPLYWVFVGLVVFVAAHGIAPWADSNLTPLHVIKNVALFPLEGEPLYAVGWTLQYEIIFYLIAAALVPFLGIWGLAAALLALGWLGTYQVHEWNYLIFSPHQIEFAAGLLCYLTMTQLKRLGMFFSFLISGAMYYWTTQSVPYAALGGGIFLLVGLLNMPAAWTASRLRLLVWLGDISYSLYLCHWAITSFANYPSSFLRLPDWAAEPYRLAMILVVILVAALLHRFVEIPFVRFGRSISMRIRWMVRPMAKSTE